MLARLAIFAAIIGAVLAWKGFEEFRLSGAVKPEAQVMSCEQLVAKGPGDNAHIQLTDFVLCDFVSYVYTEKRGKWEEVWIPAVPQHGKYYQMITELAGDDGRLPDDVPAPQGDCILVKLTKARSAQDVGLINANETLTGVVINEIESVDKETRKLLADGFPGIDFEKCWIYEDDRTPPTRTKGMMMMGGGVAVAALFLFLRFRPRKPEAPAPGPAAGGDANPAPAD